MVTSATRVVNVAGLGDVTIRALSPDEAAAARALESKELCGVDVLRMGLVEPTFDALDIPPMLASPADRLADLVLAIAEFSAEVSQ